MASKDDEEMDDDCGPLLLNELEKHGINMSDLEKLRSAGYYTCEAVAYATMKNLTEVSDAHDLDDSEVHPLSTE